MKVDSPVMNPFSPYAQILGIHLYVGEEVVEDDGRIYTEVRGSENWLCQDGNLFYVVDSNNVLLSEKYTNPSQAVASLRDLDPGLVQVSAATLEALVTGA
jgi:hypothetical protein